MIDRLVQSLIQSQNEAADEVLLEALRLGSPAEQTLALEALLKRATVRGLSGVIDQFATLTDGSKRRVLKEIKAFFPALRECGRSSNTERRLAALKLIALGRQGKLAYVVSENLHDVDERISNAATEVLVALARWCATESRNLQKAPPGEITPELRTTYQLLIENRDEIETAIARAIDVHRGRHGQDLLRASLLLADSANSKTFGILQTPRHGGQAAMIRRLAQVPDSEHVEAFLLAASHAQLRNHFGITFGHIDEPKVLDAILRRTHWLKDQHLQVCMHQVTRGVWWGENELAADLERRTAPDAARLAEWIASSGTHDAMQDQRLIAVKDHCRSDFAARARILRIALNRKRGTSVELLRSFLTDPDERLARMSARDIVRRKPADFENILLQLMTTTPDSVRRVISRSIGNAGFEHFWNRFDRMDKVTRRQAGKATIKLLPDAHARLARKLSTGPVDQRIKAMQIAQELGLCEALRSHIEPLCQHPHPKVRSKAVSLLGDVAAVTSEMLLDRVLNDTDARVRANAVEVLESRRQNEYVPLLMQRARNAHNRERANAIKALHSMKVTTASSALVTMLKDERSEHRISALWALRQIGWWDLINEVGRLAKEDENIRVRRYALTVLRSVAQLLDDQRKQRKAS